MLTNTTFFIAKRLLTQAYPVLLNAETSRNPAGFRRERENAEQDVDKYSLLQTLSQRLDSLEVPFLKA